MTTSRALFLFVLATLLHSADVPSPSLLTIDPDDYFDNLGASSENSQTPGERSVGSRTDFGAGQLIASFGSGSDAGRAIIIQTDGRIILGGRADFSGLEDFGLMRMNPDGSIDTAFGSNGKIVTTFATLSTHVELVHALVLQTDGQILAAGKGPSNSSYFDFAIARYNVDGSLDTSFHSDGRTTFPVHQDSSIARGAALDANGRLVVAGYGLNNPNKFQASLARITTDGLLDSSFDTDGKVTVMGSYYETYLMSVWIDTSSRIVTAGGVAVLSGSNSDFIVYRTQTDGTLDTSFSSAGYLTFSVGSGDEIAYAVTRDLLGNVIVAGSTKNDTHLDFALAVLRSDGVLETSFNSLGVRKADFSANDDAAYSVRAQTDGKILVTGKVHNGTNLDFGAMKFRTDGILETSFHSDGMVATDINANEDAAQALLDINADAFILGGRASNGTVYQFAVARYNTDGSLAGAGGYDLGFGTGGMIIASGNGVQAAGFYLQSDGKMLRGVGNATDAQVFRWAPDGTLDTSFSSDGIIDFAGAYSVNHFQLDLSGTIYVTTGPGGVDFGAYRLLSDGSLDTSFHSDGYTVTGISGSDYPYSSVLQTDGNFLQVGSANAHWGLVRYTSSGNLDTAFRSTGKLLQNVGGPSEFLWGLVQDPNQKLIAVGRGRSGNYNGYVVRYNTDGQYDTTFSNDGVFSISGASGWHTFNSIVRDSNGTLTVGGAGNLGLTGRALTFRLTSDGTLDATFDTDGKKYFTMTSPTDRVYEMRPGTKGKLYFAASILSGAGDLSDCAVGRFESDGNFDTSFFSTGYRKFIISGNDYLEEILPRPDGRLCAAGVTWTASKAFTICVWQ